ncbi:unnamed protein product [Amoebophrya sp. A25]|nr:unnamed protein product [Amoebophrya sp. A25]|eukprot:GSA25T00018515001.1
MKYFCHHGWSFDTGEGNMQPFCGGQDASASRATLKETSRLAPPSKKRQTSGRLATGRRYAVSQRRIQRCLASVASISAVLAQIHVISPKSLRDEFARTGSTVYGTTATFGAPYYGSRVLGKLLYGDSKTGEQYCTSDDYDLPASSYPPDESNLMPIVLVRRGSCSFAKKVRIAEQDKRAAAVIIVDKDESPKTAEQIQATIMADDESGTGTAVKIPSLLVAHYEGNRLVEAVRKAEEDHEAVIVKLAWDIPQSNYVLTDFWFSSGSREANRFLQQFADLAESFKELLSFVPHYHIISLPAESDSMELCLQVPDDESSSKNKFCAPDPDGPGKATGRMVVEEDLRQLCIFKNSEKWKDSKVKNGGELFGYSEDFWKYVRSFWADCAAYGRNFSKFTKSCSERTMAKHGIDKSQIEQCTQNEWKTLLSHEIRNHAWSPLALRINGWRYSGPIETSLVMRAVCGGYLNRPQQCADFAELVKYQASASGDGLAITLPRLGILLCVVLVLFAVLFRVYKRYLTSSVRHALREEVMLEVRSQMADYAPLDDGGPAVREMKKFSF